ncbi:Autophagy protein 22 [Actinomortierella wolfii]|nr:Autophagy protein 22 [Actinomortierella wolfii]
MGPPKGDEAAALAVSTDSKAELGSIEIQEGEDTTKTLTRREIQGWLAYSAAAEPYSVVGVSALLPIILEALASQYGYMNSDHTMKCDTQEVDYQCDVKVGGLWIDTASFSLYCVAISVFLQALVFISTGAHADHGRNRKAFLMMWAIVGSISTALFAAVVNASMFWVAGLLVIVSNVAFGASWVQYYAFIPAMARVHTDTLEAQQKAEAGTGTWENFEEVRDRVANTLSTHSMAVGYAVGVTLLIIAAGITLALGKTTYAMQLGVALTGVWWFLVSVTFVYKYMPSIPGEPLGHKVNLLAYSWVRLYKTLRQVRSLSETFKFLVAWFILSDGYSTIISLAIFMGRKKFLMNDVELMIGAIVVPFSAMVGSYMWLLIQRRFGLSSKHMVLAISTAYVVVPIYAMVGFSDVFGLVHKVEVWPVMVYFGLMLGAIQSYCRVLFGTLVPKGHESEFFSLYGITDKSSSWLGPLITGAIIAHNDTRYGFIFPLCMMVVPLFIIAWIDVDKGIKEAERFAQNHSDAKDAAFGSSSSNRNNKVLLKDVKTLTLRQGKQTTFRRTYAVPQLKCVGGNAKSSGFRPDVVQCTNMGSDGVDIQWECKADLPDNMRFGEIEVFCEGYDYPEDPYVLKGSCGLEYTLQYTGYSGGGSHWESGYEPFDAWRANIVISIICSCINQSSRPRDDPPPPYHPTDPRSGGGGPGFGGGGAPPPGYYKSTDTSSSEGGFRPGFWSGVGLGGAAAYLAASAANRERERERQREYDYFARSGGAGPSTGGYGGYRSSGMPSRTSSSSSSSGTRTATGFGGTRRR